MNRSFKIIGVAEARESCIEPPNIFENVYINHKDEKKNCDEGHNDPKIKFGHFKLKHLGETRDFVGHQLLSLKAFKHRAFTPAILHFQDYF